MKIIEIQSFGIHINDVENTRSETDLSFLKFYFSPFLAPYRWDLNLDLMALGVPLFILAAKNFEFDANLFFF